MAKEAKKKEIKKNNKDKKSFGKGFKAELKKVVWPTPAELAKSTLAVIAIVIIIVAIVFCLDFVFEAMNTYGIDKLKNAVQTSEENNAVENTVENTETETENTTEESATEPTTENVEDAPQESVEENVQE